MALTLEDGTGVTNADSYASVAAADSFHTARSNAAWAAAASTAAKEVALRLASDYIDLNHLSGNKKLVSTQGLSFPFESTQEVAADLSTIARATIMLAPLALSGDLIARTPDTAQVLSSTDKVGDISESRTYKEVNGAILINGKDVSFLYRLLGGFSSTGGIVLGRRERG